MGIPEKQAVMPPTKFDRAHGMMGLNKRDKIGGYDRYGFMCFGRPTDMYVSFDDYIARAVPPSALSHELVSVRIIRKSSNVLQMKALVTGTSKHLSAVSLGHPVRIHMGTLWMQQAVSFIHFPICQQGETAQDVRDTVRDFRGSTHDVRSAAPPSGQFCTIFARSRSHLE